MYLKFLSYCLVGLAVVSSGQTFGDYPISMVHSGEAAISGGFWAPRLDTNHRATVPHLLYECDSTGRIDNFRRAAGTLDSHFEGWWFNDSDVYKAIEAGARVLEFYDDPILEEQLDSLIAVIAAAQEDDGYLFTPRRTTGPEYRYAKYIGTTRWDSLRHSHELYDLGHMYEAAVAYFESTGKRSLLDVAVRSADLLVTLFGEGKRMLVPGHQEIEIGLTKLFRTTGNASYARLAKFFLDQRGNRSGHQLYGTYNQDHLPVVAQSEAVGHSVRALYMYAGMADMVALYRDTSYAAALHLLWNDVTGRKTYVTGGIGAEGGHEGFADPYQLPNRSAYCETCAGIANILWNIRMFRLSGDSKYIDVLERTLYNSVLSGVSVGGRTFFYDNPLESDGSNERSPWFAVACCPPNIGRILPQVAELSYAYDPQRIYLNLFTEGTVTLPRGSRRVRLTTTTDYPAGGRLRVTIDTGMRPEPFTLAVRIPGWARGEAMPLGLYAFLDSTDDAPVLRVNGQEQDMVLKQGYAEISRTWTSGDEVELLLPMPIRRLISRPEVEADRGRVALQRGPLVFCAEGTDAVRGSVLNTVLPDDSPLQYTYRADLLGGTPTITGTAREVLPDAGAATLGGPETFVAIPYYAWAQRGKTEMQVWIARTQDVAKTALKERIGKK